ncbi:MAG: P-type conjugative transfer protein TrbJ [Rhodospirillales bacterium 69-11]|nr:MAG: P-type conjugative transfer protein TrbJ [Rhodospirillales bacterium 69-11]
MKRRLVTVFLATALCTATLIMPAHAQLFGGTIVFDPQNYAQNLLTAARELQQVNNEIQSLQNEAAMLQNMGKNLSSLNISQIGTMISALTHIGNLMNQGSGIAFNVNATDSAWNTSYPSSYAATTPTATLAANAQTRWQQAMEAFQLALNVQAQIVQNVQGDSATLTNLVNTSQDAVGNLQVSQATNQLLALSTKQQLQLQNLMAAQYRANALDAARAAETEADGRASFQKFMGSSSAYTPQ